MSKIEGRLWIDKEDKSFLGHGRIVLLQKIDEFGSISKAAKAMKMSYKAAWDAIDIMNNLSPQPLVTTATGGRGGGGTHLTPYGKEIIKKFQILEEEHKKFLNNLSKKFDDSSTLFKLYESISMKVTARNKFLGEVETIKRGKINSEVVVKLVGGDLITSTVTNESLKELGIKKGVEVYAIIKSSSIIVAKKEPLQISARNRLLGKITSIKEGLVDIQLKLKLKGENSLSVVITKDALEELDFYKGEEVYALFKAGSVILGVI